MQPPPDIWCPARRLRHIRAIHVRNLTGVPRCSNCDNPGAYFALWSHLSQEAFNSNSLPCVYVSEAVFGTCAPEWAPLDFTHLLPTPDVLHAADSGLLHLHIYTLDASKAPGYGSHSRPVDGPACSPGNSFAQHSHPLPAPSDSNEHGQNAADNDQVPLMHKQVLACHKRGEVRERRTSTEGLREILPRRGDSAESLKSLEVISGDARGDPGTLTPRMTQATRAALTCCQDMQLPGKLQLASSFSLAALHLIAPDFEALADLDPAYPPNTVLVEMGDGIYAQPGVLAQGGGHTPRAQPGQDGGSPMRHRRNGAMTNHTTTSTHAPSTPVAPEEYQGALPGVLRALLWRSAVAESPHQGDESSHTPSSSALHAEAGGGAPHSPFPPPSTLRFLQGQGTPLSPPRLAQHAAEAAPSFASPRGISPQSSGTSIPLRTPLAPPSATQAPGCDAQLWLAGGMTQDMDTGELLEAMASLASAQEKLQASLRHRMQLQGKLQQMLESERKAQAMQDTLSEARQSAAEQRGVCERASIRVNVLTKHAATMQTMVELQRRALEDAHSALKGARGRLKVAAGMLEEQGRVGRWGQLRAKLTARRCRLASNLGTLFAVQPQAVLEPAPPPGGFVWDMLDESWAGLPHSPSAPPPPIPSAPSQATPGPRPNQSGADRLERLATVWFQGGEGLHSQGSDDMYRETAMLTVGGLYLSPQLYQRRKEDDQSNPLDTDPEQVRKTASALGYVAALVALLAAYLDVPLRYPLKLASSRSAVLDAAAPAGRSGVLRQHLTSDSGRAMVLLSRSESRVTEAELATMLPPPTEFPLFFSDPADRMRFPYAAFLLNKDVEQLLDAHGLFSVGPSALLANIYKLLCAAASGIPASARQP